MTLQLDGALQKKDIAEEFTTGGWEFTPDVVRVFDDHVRASVPFYDAIQNLVAEVADWALPTGGMYADLGASTGATLGVILDRHGGRDFTACLYDEQSAMLDRAKATLNPRAGGSIRYYQQKVQEPYQHHDADLTTALFLLQFLPLADRQTVLTLARQHAADTGCLIVAEKVRLEDSRWAEIANERSHDYKSAHGISDAAIRAKARALRGVLVPHSEATLRNAIFDAGWDTPTTLFCWHNWLVLGAFAR
jgi:tRNA (cmo5U34)-methyltransferase